MGGLLGQPEPHFDPLPLNKPGDDLVAVVAEM